MSLLHSAARKLMLPALLLVASAFLINGAVNVWSTWREAEALMASLQREKAEAAAAQIDQHMAALQSQITWAATERGASVPAEQLRYEFLRLLRQVPAITEITQLSVEGKEVLKVSRLVKDAVGSGDDFSADVRYTEALKRKSYVGPVYFSDRSEPFVSLAIAPARPNAGVTLAEVSVKRIRDIIDAIRVGESGYAYLVDAKGRLIAARGQASVSQTDVASLPQVAAAAAGTLSQGMTYDKSIAGPAVLSTHAAVPSAQWQVFVELPLAEARAPLWSASARAASLLGLGLLAVLLASLAARRKVHMQTART